MTGATLVMMERFDAATALAEIARHRVTVFDGVPTMYAMMLADPSLPGADLSSLRVCSVGGQTMPAAKMAEWERRSRVPLLEIWGMTELGGAGTSNCAYHAHCAWLDRLCAAKPGSAGRRDRGCARHRT